MNSMVHTFYRRSISKSCKEAAYLVDSAKYYSEKPSSELLRYFLTYKLCSMPKLLTLGKFIFPKFNNSMIATVARSVIRKTFFKQFCGGEDVLETKAIIEKLKADHINVILDYAAEPFGLLSKEDCYFEYVKNNVLAAIALASCCSDSDLVAIKLSALFSLNDLKGLNTAISDHKDVFTFQSISNHSFLKGMKRLDEIVSFARSHKIKITVDAEQSFLQHAIDHIVILMMRKYNSTDTYSSPTIYTTYQLYRRDSQKRLQQHLIDSKQYRYHFATKLVRGAYLEEEKEKIRTLHIDDVIFDTKSETDQAYNECILQIFNYADSNRNDARKFDIILATHNHDSVQFACEVISNQPTPQTNLKVSFAQLYGMSDSISFTLARNGFKVFKYLPFGPINEVIPYLLRRAQENASAFQLARSEASSIKSELYSRIIRTIK